MYTYTPNMYAHTMTQYSLALSSCSNYRNFNILSNTVFLTTSSDEPCWNTKLVTPQTDRNKLMLKHPELSSYVYGTGSTDELVSISLWQLILILTPPALSLAQPDPQRVWLRETIPIPQPLPIPSASISRDCVITTRQD